MESIEEKREGFECIHVMDREGDMFDLMSLAVDLGACFIIRANGERALAGGQGHVEDVLAQIRPRTQRKVQGEPPSGCAARANEAGTCDRERSTGRQACSRKRHGEVSASEGGTCPRSRNAS